ncbi:MAG: cyanophycinase [Schlesneria sp.]|nr:cyanophycinase [Schlesneria sp.]
MVGLSIVSDSLTFFTAFRGSRLRSSRWTAQALVGACLLAATWPAAAEDVARPKALLAAQLATPVPGTLFICGGGVLTPAIIDKFFELGGGKKARVVLVTTASITAGSPEIEEKYSHWRGREHTSLDFFHAATRIQADDPVFCQKLESATAIWFVGGNQSLLTDAYLGTHAEKMFHAVLRRRGVVGGTSAGAAIMSATMIAGGKTEPVMSTGFGFLPGTIVDQHFRKRNREERLKQALQLHPGHVGIGIDESTALIVRGRSVEVMGESDVTVCLAPTPQRVASEIRLAHGSKDDLIKLSRAAVARSRHEFPVADKQIPEVKEGTLVIVGGGATPREAVDQFLSAAGGKDSPIIVVSNALADEPPEEQKVCGWLKDAGASNVRQVHARDKQELAQADLQTWLKEAKGVWFTGGRQWRLVDAYLDTPIQLLFQDVLHRGGVIGGTSAGATIQGEYLVRGNPLGNEDMMAEGYERGFCFLPGVAIDQHFSQRDRLDDMTELKKIHPQLVGIGIDEATAMIVRGTTLEVVGRNRVSIFDRGQDATDRTGEFEIVTAGQRYDFKNHRRMEQAIVEATATK